MTGGTLAFREGLPGGGALRRSHQQGEAGVRDHAFNDISNMVGTPTLIIW